ncbi:MAG: hypothetical protein BMS9Abin37_1121 [Acidobacteriota bacterium]|nr:MAG: hypothetical protein BMS9Abin37_1121 [Acidobacteriota bacterium]
MFLHGGLTPEVAELGLDRVNQLVKEAIGSIAKSSEVLEEIVKGPASFPELIRHVSEEYGVPIDELEEQVIRARVFDALIGNLDRRDDDKLFIPGEGRVALVDHERCFTPTTEIHPFLLANCSPMPADLENELRSLDQEELQANVGGHLTPAQIDFVLAGRDRIVETCRSAPQ